MIEFLDSYHLGSRGHLTRGVDITGQRSALTRQLGDGIGAPAIDELTEEPPV